MCTEADAATSAVSLSLMFPDATDDFGSIQTFYADLNTELQRLSEVAAGLDEDQLARDFSSVGKNANSVAAVASLASTIGYGNAVLEWMDSIGQFSDNEAFKSQSDPTFIGC
jgi:hypothetical protein